MKQKTNKRINFKIYAHYVFYTRPFSILLLSLLLNHSFWHKILLIYTKKNKKKPVFYNLKYLLCRHKIFGRQYLEPVLPPWEEFVEEEWEMFHTPLLLLTFCVSIAPTISLHGLCVLFILPSSVVDVSFWDSSYSGVVSISFSSSFEVGTTSFRKKLHGYEANSSKYVAFLRVSTIAFLYLATTAGCGFFCISCICICIF